MIKKIGLQNIELAKNGNRQILSDIIDDFWQPIFRYAFKKTLDLKHAISLTEQTFVRALSDIKNTSFEDSDSLGIWLYKIARGESAREWSLFGRKKNIHFPNRSLSYLRSELKEAEVSIRNDRNFDQIKRLLRKLGSAQRDVVVLHYMEQESLENIARIFETKLDEIKKIKTRALDKLELFMGKETKRARI